MCTSAKRLLPVPTPPGRRRVRGAPAPFGTHPCPGHPAAAGCRSRLGGCGVKPALLASAATSRARGMLGSEPTPSAPGPRGGGGGDGGVVRAGCCLCRWHSFSGRVAGPREWLLRAEAAPSKSAERCWCQPGKDQSLYQRVCVGGLIFVCRSQMVKEESDKLQEQEP